MKRLVLLLLMSTPCLGFTTISEAERYAAEVPEYPESATEDLEQADYSQVYNDLQPSWWERILQTVYLQSKPAWQPKNIIPLLEKLKEYSSPEEIHLTLPPETEIITFGSLYGAFHSLTRGLTDLRNRGKISNEFMLSDKVYLVFLGNAVDFSPYSLETLTLILTLIQKNKDKVIYLAGPHELKKTWHKYGLKKELDQRLPRQAAKLSRKLDKLFARLPKRLWVNKQLLFSTEELESPEEGKEHPYRVMITGDTTLTSYGGSEGLYKEVESATKTIWHVVSSPVMLYRMKHRFFYDAYAHIRLGKQLEQGTISLLYSTGTVPFAEGSLFNLAKGSLLKRGVLKPAITTAEPMPLSLDKLDGAIHTIHELVTSREKQIEVIKQQLPGVVFTDVPTAHTELLEKLKAGSPLTQQQVQQAAFEVEQLYNELAEHVEVLVAKANQKGLKTEVPKKEEVDESTIVMGSSMDVSKSVKGLGIPFRSGIALKVNKKNREGGIEGKRVQIIFLDDGYIPAVARQNIETILKVYKSPYILAPVGSPTLLAYLDLIKDKKILVLFPQSGSPTFRDKELRNIVHLRASFNDEGKLLTNYVLKNYLPKNFVFFYQNDEFGVSILNGAKQALEKAGVPPATEVSYQANTTYFKGAAAKLRQANPDAIGFFATGPATLQLIRDIGVEFLANKVLYAVSSVGDAATVKILKDRGLKVIIGQVVPDPTTSMLPIVKEYREEIKRQGLKPNVFALESYITSSIAFRAIKRVDGPLTMEKLIEQFEKMKNFDYKGIILNFNPKTRALTSQYWINTGEGPWLEQIVQEQTVQEQLVSEGA